MSLAGCPRIERLWTRSYANEISPMMSVSASTTGCCPYVPKTSCVLHAELPDVNALNQMVLSMPDKAAGNHVVRLNVSMGEERPVSDNMVATPPSVVLSSTTDAIPSSRAIGCLMSIEQRMLVADDLGNVYLASDGDDKPAANKRARTEGSSQAKVSSSSWVRVVSAVQAEPMRGGLPQPGASCGWVGVAPVGGKTSAAPQIVCTREHFLDSRVLDVHSTAVVRSFYHMQAPTAVTTVDAMPDAFLTAEGALMATYDVRCAHRVASHRVSMSSGTMYYAAALGATRPHEVVSSQSDRSVIVWDVRTWGRVRTLPSVLKYVVMSVTPIYGGDYIVCTGVDAEVRVVATAAPAKESVPKKKAPQLNDGDHAAPGVETVVAPPGASSFRNRINETEHCESVWHGAWAPIVNGPGAVGIAMSNECYLVR